MLTKKVFLVAAIAMLSVSANAARLIAPKVPEIVDGCYQISTAAELYGAMNSYTYDYKGNCLKLVNDIVVNRNVLGEDGSLNVADTANFIQWASLSRFSGVFDGQGHSISGLYVNNPRTAKVGLFGSFGETSPGNRTWDVEIKNLHLEDVYFRAYYDVGGFVGEVRSGVKVTIEHCSVDGVIIAEADAAGGFVGEIYDIDSSLVVLNSYNSASVTAQDAVGGIVGDVYDGEGRIAVANTYNVGTISGWSNVGGIIGYLYFDVKSLKLANVFNVGSVSKENGAKPGAPMIGYGWNLNEMDADNVFFLSSGESKVGVAMTEEQFANGTVASIMHGCYYGGVDGSVWGQNVGTDPLPNFSGVVSGAVDLPTITLSLDTGSAVLWTTEIAAGYRHRIPDVMRENYELFGWYDNAELTGEKVTHVPDTQTTDVKFWGYYERVYKVTLETSGGTVPVGGVESYVHTLGAKLPGGALREGYIFAGWYANSDFSGNPVDSITATDEGDKTFYAKWVEKRTPGKNADGCYAISDAGELYGFAAMVNGMTGDLADREVCAVLTQDIVVNKDLLDADGVLNRDKAAAAERWNPIDSFVGTFDGQMHTISGLLVLDTLNEETPAEEKRPVGFIASMWGTKEKPVVVKNLGVIGSAFLSSAYRVGGIVGFVMGIGPGAWYETLGKDTVYAEIRNVYNASIVYGGDGNSSAGGLVGLVQSDSHLFVENSYNLGMVNSEDRAAGLIGGGNEKKFRIENCYNAGEVYGKLRNHLVMNVCYGCEFKGIVFNSYYLYRNFSNSRGEVGGRAVDEDEFADGRIALALHMGENGSIWGQNVGVDSYPVLSGTVENSTATWYNVTFHTFEGDTATYFDYYVAGLHKTLPRDVSVKDENMLFAGWYANADFSGDEVLSIYDDDEGDLEFFAKYDLKSFNIIVRPNNSNYGKIYGLVNANSGTYKYGTKVTFEAEAYSGYEFYYWEDDVENTDPIRSFTILGDTTITAHFGVARSSSSSVVSSSSSSAPKSSSSSAKSSSSSAPKSSSSVTPQSSSSNTKSSSSSRPAASSSSVNSKSSSSCKNCFRVGLTPAPLAPRFGVEVAGRNILVTGASIGQSYVLLDTQGRVLRKGRLESAVVSIPVSHAGVYLVHINNRLKRVSVR